MRFAAKVKATASFVSLAALLAAPGDASAGNGQSGHSGGSKKPSLGASYARRSSSSGGSGQHIPGKSGIGKPASKSTGSSGLGSSRVATSKHTSSAAVKETAPVVKSPVKKSRPIKTHAETRAVKARVQAKEAENAAGVAEAEAGAARQSADKLGQAAVRHAQTVASAKTAVKSARQSVIEAERNESALAAQALADHEVFESLKSAAKKKKGSKALRAFVSAISFGWVKPAEDVSSLLREVGRQAQASARAAGRASAEVDDARDAMVEAEQALASAELSSQTARTHYRNAEERARDLEAKAIALRSEAGTLAGTAAELEDAADAAVERYQHKIARVDQHRLRVSGLGASERNRFRRAARRFKLTTFIESKPSEVTQDALAAAPEKGLFAIADGVTNSDYSGEFARSLVRRWTEAAPESEADFTGWLGGAQAEWDAEVKPIIAGKAGAWYNRNRTWQGDAAFVGARLTARGGQRQLHLTGIGDTVAFLVRGGRIVKSFPLERAAEFSDVVKALPSVGAPLHPALNATWQVEPGDEVFMGTDALSAWMLGETEAGRDPLPALRAIGSQKQMNRFVADARAGSLADHGAMGVDDTALLRFVVPADQAED